jgi:L-fucose mutarotase
MLIGISPVISPELLVVLDKMGHGDELVLSDAFYPADTCNQKVIRSDGIRIPVLLDGIMRLINIDSYVPDALVMMEPVKGDVLDTSVEEAYMEAVHHIYPDAPAVKRISRFEFYERSKSAFAVVVTGETVKYGNIIIKKGVVPVSTDYLV